jgi:hypothetical protein
LLESLGSKPAHPQKRCVFRIDQWVRIPSDPNSSWLYIIGVRDICFRSVSMMAHDDRVDFGLPALVSRAKRPNSVAISRMSHFELLQVQNGKVTESSDDGLGMCLTENADSDHDTRLFTTRTNLHTHPSRVAAVTLSCCAWRI